MTVESCVQAAKNSSKWHQHVEKCINVALELLKVVLHETIPPKVPFKRPMVTQSVIQVASSHRKCHSSDHRSSKKLRLLIKSTIQVMIGRPNVQKVIKSVIQVHAVVGKFCKQIIQKPFIINCFASVVQK